MLSTPCYTLRMMSVRHDWILESVITRVIIQTRLRPVAVVQPQSKWQTDDDRDLAAAETCTRKYFACMNI